MRFNVLALSLTSGLICGALILIVASAHAIWPSYGGAFLDLASSIYSGYDTSPGIGSIVIGTLYGVVDGAIGGAIFGWLYNYFARNFSSSAA
jgi:phosphotransferase system  glucose/maltose/N-acetylglucosamine-specific IIC component